MAVWKIIVPKVKPPARSVFVELYGPDRRYYGGHLAQITLSDDELKNLFLQDSSIPIASGETLIVRRES